MLGTPHLAGELGENFSTALLDSLIAILKRFRPDLIGVESLPAKLVADMEQRGETPAQALRQFSGNQLNRLTVGHRAQRMLSMSHKEARQEADTLLQSSNMVGTYGKLRTSVVDWRLTLYLLAAYDLNSALLQWLYLSEEIQNSSDILPEDILEYLSEQAKSSNEIVTIGLRLARELGLQTVADIDDLQDEEILEQVAPQFETEITDNPILNNISRAPLYADFEQRVSDAAVRGDLLPLYLYCNSKEFQMRDVQTQWHSFFLSRLVSGHDRLRVSLWEMRNLNIAANIRRETALRRAKRMIVIIGAAHKPFLDAYLQQMMDIKLVHLDNLITTGD